jgi:hypothetical protein
MKERMKQILCITFTICLCGLFLILNITGCASHSDETTSISDEESTVSFVIVEKELVNGYFYKIAYHKDTKVMYVLGQYNDFEVMLDADGKPLLWEDN